MDSGISYKIYLEPLKHALSLCLGLANRFYNFIEKIIQLTVLAANNFPKSNTLPTLYLTYLTAYLNQNSYPLVFHLFLNFLNLLIPSIWTDSAFGLDLQKKIVS